MENNIITEDVRRNVMKDIYANPTYMSLNKKYQEHRKVGNYAQMMVYSKKMKEFEMRVFSEIAQRYIDKHNIMTSIIGSMNSEDRHKMNILANALYLMTDVLDAMIIDTNAILKKYDVCESTGFDKLSGALKEAKGLVAHFDTIMNDDMTLKIFGECSDNLYKLIYNKSSSYVNKLKKYAEDVNKKITSGSEVA